MGAPSSGRAVLVGANQQHLPQKALNHGTRPAGARIGASHRLQAADGAPNGGERPSLEARRALCRMPERTPEPMPARKLAPMPLDWTPLQAAIVDLDGTMVDTVGDFEVALNAMLTDHALPPVDRAFIARTVGKGSEHLIRSTLAQVGAEASLYASAFARYQHHYLAINGQHSVVYPGVVDGLRQLAAAGLQLACLTNKPTAFARPLLAAKGLDGFFAHVFGGDAFARKKPDPLPLLETCRALGSLPAHTLMVGDSSNDAQAARAAGCPVVLVNYGYNHGQPVADARPDAVIAGLNALAPPARRSEGR
jgi:phosphoglycolate phosphatase